MTTTAKRFDRLLNLTEIGVLSLAYGAAVARNRCDPGTASQFTNICQTRLRALIESLNAADEAAKDVGHDD